MLSIWSFNVISVVVPEPKIFLCIPASAPDAAVVNSNGIKILLANILMTFLLMAILILVTDQEVYQEILLIESFYTTEFSIT